MCFGKLHLEFYCKNIWKCESITHFAGKGFVNIDFNCRKKKILDEDAIPSLTLSAFFRFTNKNMSHIGTSQYGQEILLPQTKG